MPDLDITVVHEGAGPALVSVGGEIDVATAPEFRECLAGVEGDVVVDVSRVTFIDSTALAVLVGATTRTRDAGFAFTLQGESEFVERLLKVAGLDSFFHPNGQHEG